MSFVSIGEVPTPWVALAYWVEIDCLFAKILWVLFAARSWGSVVFGLVFGDPWVAKYLFDASAEALNGLPTGEARSWRVLLTPNMLLRFASAFSVWLLGPLFLLATSSSRPIILMFFRSKYFWTYSSKTVVSPFLGGLVTAKLGLSNLISVWVMYATDMLSFLSCASASSRPYRFSYSRWASRERTSRLEIYCPVFQNEQDFLLANGQSLPGSSTKIKGYGKSSYLSNSELWLRNFVLNDCWLSFRLADSCSSTFMPSLSFLKSLNDLLKLSRGLGSFDCRPFY